MTRLTFLIDLYESLLNDWDKFDPMGRQPLRNALRIIHDDIMTELTREEDVC